MIAILLSIYVLVLFVLEIMLGTITLTIIIVLLVIILLIIAASILSYHPQDIPLSSIPRTCAAVNYIWNIRMENSDGNLFCSWFHQSAGAYQGSGRVSQNYAKTLAENGANYVEILHYFYDNSDRSDESIIITCNGSHSSIKVEPYSYLYHGPACTKCHTHTGTGSAHTFVNYNTHYECTVCGYTTMSPALPKRASGEDVLQ